MGQQEGFLVCFQKWRTIEPQLLPLLNTLLKQGLLGCLPMLLVPIVPDLFIHESAQFGLPRTCERMTLLRLSLLKLLSSQSNIARYRSLSLEPLGSFLLT